jgi:anti-sigma factor RsiW
MRYDPDILLRYHEGRLSPEERETLEKAIASEAALAAESEDIGAIRSILRAERPDGFRPFFSERVLRRLRPTEAPDVSFYLSLRWAFVRASAVAVLAVITLASLNAGTYGELDIAASFVDAVFGIPDASPIDAWTYTSIAP